MPASTDQVEVSGAAFVPVSVKVHGSLLESALVVIQPALAKTVPRTWQEIDRLSNRARRALDERDSTLFLPGLFSLLAPARGNPPSPRCFYSGNTSRPVMQEYSPMMGLAGRKDAGVPGEGPS